MIKIISTRNTQTILDGVLITIKQGDELNIVNEYDDVYSLKLKDSPEDINKYFINKGMIHELIDLLT